MLTKMTVNGNLRYPSFRQLPGFLRQVGNVRQEKEKPTESEWWVGWRNSIAVACRQYYRGAFKAFKPSVGTGARLVPQSPDVFPGGLAGCVCVFLWKNFVPYLPWSTPRCSCLWGGAEVVGEDGHGIHVLPSRYGHVGKCHLAPGSVSSRCNMI